MQGFCLSYLDPKCLTKFCSRPFFVFCELLPIHAVLLCAVLATFSYSLNDEIQWTLKHRLWRLVLLLSKPDWFQLFFSRVLYQWLLDVHCGSCHLWSESSVTFSTSSNCRRGCSGYQTKVYGCIFRPVTEIELMQNQISIKLALTWHCSKYTNLLSIARTATNQ